MDILILGQSNGVRLGGTGEEAMTALLEASIGEPVTIINAAVGSTALTAVEPDYWLETGPGTLYDNALAAVGDTSIDAVVWIQGESDALSGVDAATYQAALGEFFTRLRTDLGEVPVYLQPLILRQEVFGEIRAAQLNYAAGDPLTHLVDPQQELGWATPNHFHHASYSVLGDAIARAMLDDLGIAPAWLPTTGTEAGESIAGCQLDDRIYAGDGDDYICGRGGVDVMTGDAGADTLKGSSGADLMAGGTGEDFLGGGTDADVMFGDDAADTLRGGAGDDKLNGGADADIMAGDAGVDVFCIGGGDRVLDFVPGEDRIRLKHTLAGEITYEAGRLYAGGELLAILAGAPVLGEGDILF